MSTAYTANATNTTTTAGPDLSLRQSRDIQGDIVAGFKKDHMQLLFLRFEDAAQARTWLRILKTRISTTKEVASFNYEFSQARKRSGGDDPRNLTATWRNVSFTHQGLVTLLDGKDPVPLKPPRRPRPPLGEKPFDPCLKAFVEGPSKRAALLGDDGEGDPKNWLFGHHQGPPVHAVLTVAADLPKDLRTALSEERQQAALHKIVIVFEQDGATLEGARRGKEHFGFKDGVSEPAVKGFDTPDPDHPQWEKGHPGTRMIDAGEFVIGEKPASDFAPDVPDWMRGGSFHCVRRLAQDVPGWWAQIAAHLKELKKKNGTVPPEAGVEWLASRVVGRWRSGTPIVKCPFADPASDAEAWADNHISYADDLDGKVTPLWSHLRKTNPRDGLLFSPGDKETVPEEGVLDTRRIMRRGAPYGQPFDPAGGPANGPDAPRGLLFVSYQADLVEQFEFIQHSWINADGFPDRDPQVGKDAMVGQDTKVRFGRETLSFHQFVRTEGAVYAFAPSMTALGRLAEGKLPAGDPEPPQGDQTRTAPLTLAMGEALVAGPYRFTLQEDGDLVVLNDKGAVVWNADCGGLGGATVAFQEDGRLVVLDARGLMVWRSTPETYPGATLTLKTNGEVLITAADGKKVPFRTGVPKS
jgi:Dyp-type peroxidase family